MMAACIRFLRKSEATTSVEYAVMLALIIAVLITAISSVGGDTGGMWGGVKTSLTAAGFGS
ncbi:MAG TPA: Flp family type IVb pilin [Pirellulales bacterium]|nr:Flp family type IVb pilin [Pirellulales bacterium]